MKWVFALILSWPLVALAAPPPGGSSVLVKVAPLSRHRLPETVTGYGTVSADPHTLTSLNASHDAVVVGVGVSVGDPVMAGRTLLTLRTAPAAREAYQKALDGVDYARRELQRQRRLLSRQLATRADVASASKALRDARATLSARHKEGSNQGQTQVKAPFDGVVTNVSAAAGQHLHRGDALLTLAGVHRLVVRLGVVPAVAARLAADAPVSLTPVFGDTGAVAAVVDRVQRVADPRTGMVAAVARVTGRDADTLMVGMPVTGVITVSLANTLAVPRSAVLHDDQGDYLFIADHGTARRVNVRAGVHSGTLVGVSADGLSGGVSVVVQGNYELRDGAGIRESNQ